MRSCVAQGTRRRRLARIGTEPDARKRRRLARAKNEPDARKRRRLACAKNEPDARKRRRLRRLSGLGSSQDPYGIAELVFLAGHEDEDATLNKSSVFSSGCSAVGICLLFQMIMVTLGCVRQLHVFNFFGRGVSGLERS